MIRKISLFILIVSVVCSCGGNNGEPKYLDPEQSVEVRVKDLMGRMTLEEKVAQMCQYVSPSHMRQSQKKLKNKKQNNSDTYSLYRGMNVEDVEKLTEEGMIGSFLHCTTAEETNRLQQLAAKSRLGIPLLIGIDAIHGNGLVSGSTVYPTPLSMASSWCDSLVEEASRETALEMRAMGAHWAFTPNVDIARDARWGRFGETCGEDTYLTGRMGVAQIKGLQGSDFTGSDKVIACVKHMVGGGDPVNGSNAAPTDVSPYTLYNVHFPPYRQAVEDAGVWSVMMAHNELNGLPCHASKYLMTDILRKEYGFEGFIVSDWMDIERIAQQGVAASEDDAFVMSVAGGMDMHMHGPKFFEKVVAAVKDGRLSQDRVDDGCSKILEAKFRLGLFEDPLVDLDSIKSSTFTQEHCNTALELARKGVILLKNEGCLPLDGNNGEKTSPRKIFLTGLNADNHAILGDWVLPQPDKNVVTIREGLEYLCVGHNASLKYFNCGDMVSKFDSQAKIEEAVSASKGSDIAVVAVGENSLRYLKDATCGENIDRADIILLNGQRNLVRKLKKTGIPVVVVFVTGRPLAEEWIAVNADAVLWAWEPGCMGGRAIAEILFGEINPSGKLTASIPRHVGQIKNYYNSKPFHYFHTPFDVAPGPIYPFGYGLSYTDFEYSDLALSSKTIGAGGSVTVSVNVRNVGNRKGDEVVQLYIRDMVSSLTRPVKELKGYERISVFPGETARVEFTLTPETLSFYDGEMNRIAEKGVFKIMVGSSSLDKDLLSVDMELISDVSL